MYITKAQLGLFGRLWKAACLAQGWTAKRGMRSVEIDAKRKEVIRQCGFSSLKLVDKEAGFGRVKATLERLADKVQGAIEESHPELDVARRMRAKITFELIPLLGVYREDPWAAVQSIIDDKFPKRGYTVRELDNLTIVTEPRVRELPNGEKELYESPSELEQLLMTVTRAVSRARHEKEHSGHDNYVAAGLQKLCKCARCKPKRSVQLVRPDPDAEPVTVGETQPF